MDSEHDPAHAAPGRPLLTGWQIVALVALVLAAGFALLLLLPTSQRRDVLNDLGGVFVPYIAPILGALAAGVAAWAARGAKLETARQTPMIQTAVRQTNGALTSRDAKIAALEAQLAARDAAAAAVVVSVDAGPGRDPVGDDVP